MIIVKQFYANGLKLVLVFASTASDRVCVSLFSTTSRFGVCLYRWKAATVASTLNVVNREVLTANVRVHVIAQMFWIFIFGECEENAKNPRDWAVSKKIQRNNKLKHYYWHGWIIIVIFFTLFFLLLFQHLTIRPIHVCRLFLNAKTNEYPLFAFGFKINSRFRN